MQLTAPYRRHPALGFINSTPKLQATNPSSPHSEMFGSNGMTIGAGPLYTNAIMGQAPSVAEREKVRKASSSILRRDSIHIEESSDPSRPDSFSIHYNYTDQAPYSNQEDSGMTEEDSALHLPPDNPSHDLAWFLRNTGPTAPHRRPSKLKDPKRALSARRTALRFLNLKRRRIPTLQDEGGLLAESAAGGLDCQYEQKVSSDGTRYLAIKANGQPSAPTSQRPAPHHHSPIRDTRFPAQSRPSAVQEDAEPGHGYEDASLAQQNPSILESRVSIVFEGGDDAEVTDDGSLLSERRRFPRPPTPANKLAGLGSVDDEHGMEVASDASPLPVRPAASSPPSPEPEPSAPIARATWKELQDKMEKRALDASRKIVRKPLPPSISASSSLPDILQTFDQALMDNTASGNSNIRHPMPHRFASHPVLLQRHASGTSSLYTRSISDSPGPPPRSPLRLRRTVKDVGEAKSLASEMSPSRTEPTMRASNQYSLDMQRVRPMVITDCTGPIKRPKSRGKDRAAQPRMLATRKKSEERTHGRRMRDKPLTKTQTIDAIVNPQPTPPRQRLRKARPQIQIPDLKSGQLAARGSSSASSNASWKKVTEFTRTPVSAVPSEDTQSNKETTGYTPISPTVSSLSRAETMTLSPVMLVAEEIPLQRPRVTARSTKHKPRPRSASIPGTRRRSRQGTRTPTRNHSPVKHSNMEDVPPLPSPPPTKALPPTPLAFDTESKGKTKRPAESKMINEHPSTGPLHEVAPNSANFRTIDKLPHVVNQTQKRPIASSSASTREDISARVEALEQNLEASTRNNVLLAAALNAVLRTNGALNGPISAGIEIPRAPMVWENRIARRSAATRGAAGSDRAALDAYLNSRHETRHGRL